jgi:hypothetical protein
MLICQMILIGLWLEISTSSEGQMTETSWCPKCFDTKRKMYKAINPHKKRVILSHLSDVYDHITMHQLPVFCVFVSCEPAAACGVRIATQARPVPAKGAARVEVGLFLWAVVDETRHVLAADVAFPAVASGWVLQVESDAAVLVVIHGVRGLRAQHAWSFKLQP